MLLREANAKKMFMFLGLKMYSLFKLQIKEYFLSIPVYANCKNKQLCKKVYKLAKP